MENTFQMARYEENLRFSTKLNSSNSIKGFKVRNLCKLFQSVKSLHANPQKLVIQETPKPKFAKFDETESRPLPKDRVVVYLTTLRGIRRTFEDCYAVNTIFRGFGVWVDERDISMDSAYKKELMGILGEERRLSLPQVFIRGKHIGGAEEVKRLYEDGELRKLLDGIRIREPGSVCSCCGDARFMPCVICNGSRKVFEEDEGILRRCLECNENGLVRCPNCCS